MSFWRTYYHLVWATRNRRPLIDNGMEPVLFAYLEKKALELNVVVYALNGVEDHIHLVVAIPPRYAVAEVVKTLKGGSTHYLNHQGFSTGFEWQRGYGVFTLGERQRPDAIAYVQAQKEHHKRGSINAWLERTDEIDDGPTASAATNIKEPSAIYSSFSKDDIPF